MQQAKRSKFGIIDKNGDQIWISREDFMVIYRKMMKEQLKKSKK